MTLPSYTSDACTQMLFEARSPTPGIAIGGAPGPQTDPLVGFCKLLQTTASQGAGRGRGRPPHSSGLSSCGKTLRHWAEAPAPPRREGFIFAGETACPALRSEPRP